MARGSFTALAALAAALAVAPAAAQVRLGPETGAQATVDVMSWWAIPFRTVVRQQYDFSCGSAAVATLLTYGYQRPTSERESFAAMWKTGDREAIRKKGFSLFDMRAYLQSIGYRVEGFKLTMDQLTQIKRPVIVLLDLHGYKHFAVVKGMADGQVLTGDPMLGLTKYDTKQFARHWNGVVLAILSGPDQVRPVYNLATDWNPWARAPLDAEAGTTTAVSELTSYLPPQYQITPLILLDVRVGTVN